jgi:hypothetical protein
MKTLRFVLFLGITLAKTAAAGDVANEATFFDGLARRAYRNGNYDSALESFLHVLEIAPSARVLYNVALCADLAGRRDMAFSLYEEYSKAGDPDAERRSEAERRRQQLKEKLALVQIRSDPEAATVYVDRKELGQFGSTPATLALSEGEHRIFVERAGFAAESLSVVAKAGALAALDLSLRPLFGFVTVRAIPASAKIIFSRDGAPVSASLEGGRYRLPAGQYKVLASSPGYVSVDAPVLIREDGDAHLELGLEQLPRATGTLLVSTGSVRADVYVDGRRVAVTPATLSNLGTGEHSLEVRADHRVLRRRIAIVKERATHVEFDLGGASR